jgi:hypothetical protein
MHGLQEDPPRPHERAVLPEVVLQAHWLAGRMPDATAKARNLRGVFSTC